MTDQPTFDLIDHAWILCLDREGKPVELGLREVLARAPELREIADPSPLVTVALHRLLLAVLHRTVGPRRFADWKSLWDARAFPMPTIGGYLERWRERFDLFHPERPFYQTAEVPLREKYLTPIAELAHELQLGTPPVLFQQVPDDFAVSPARAARIVVAMQTFAMGGTIGFAGEDGETATPHKYSKDGPLKKGAVVMAKGQTLFETLMLNLVRYNGNDGAPWTFNPDEDRPAWERDEPARSRERDPAGYLDLLTWQARRIRIEPAWDGGTLVVRRAILMRGEGFSEHWDETHEPMVAFRAAANAKSNVPTPWLTISFDPGRALWRNSLALYQSVDARTQRPKIATWIAELASEGWLTEDRRFAFDVLGMSTNQAKIEFWRHERMPLSLSLLDRQSAASVIRHALDSAEAAYSCLLPDRVSKKPPESGEKEWRKPLQVFVDEVLGTSSRSKARKGKQQTTRGALFVESLQLGEQYWRQLEGPFRRFLDGVVTGESQALRRWIDDVEQVANGSFEQALNAFDRSSRQVKAVSLARRQLDTMLGSALAPHREAARMLSEVA